MENDKASYKLQPVTILNWFLRIVIGIFFIYVGYARLKHPNLIAEHLMMLNLIPWPVINFFAMWMLLFEIFAGVLVVSGFWLRAASAVLIGFSILCVLLISYAIINHLSMHCGCFVTTATGSPRNWVSLYQELLVLTGCVVLFITSKKSKV